MTTSQKRLAKVVVIAATGFLAVRAIRGFPWRGTYQALLEAQLGVLFAAFVVNLFSMIAKGSAWHLLLKPLAPNRWSSAQIANFVGAAANCLSVSVAGEAVRIHNIARRDGVPVEAAVVSVIWARLVEIVGLALFLVFAPAALPLSPLWRSVQVVAGVILVPFFAFIFARKDWALPVWLPNPIRKAIVSLVQIGSWRRVVWPVALGVMNWIIQWSTFHLVLGALGVHPSLAASLMALLATNLGGLLHLTPANVGIFQATMVASLVSFGIPAERAMAASLALQAIQVVPIVAIGFLMVMPWRSKGTWGETALVRPQKDAG
jgi:hypothetical protein